MVNQTAGLVRSEEVNPYKIASVSLTKATKYALANKLSHIEEGFTQAADRIRTLHSWCFQALSSWGSKPTILKSEHLKEFFSDCGLEFKIEGESSEDEEFTAADYHNTEGNKLFQMFTKLRLTWDGGGIDTHLENFYAREKDEMFLSIKTFKSLFIKYLAWLKDSNLYDYTRLLTEAYARQVPLEGDLLILDEFQDKGNLHVLLVKAWLKNFKHVLVCGDDDQAIFTFAGSNPRHLIDFEADETVILPTSYRLPSKIHALATSVINKNRYRIPKEFKPAREGGRVDWLYSREEVLGSLNGHKTFILARNKCFVQEWKELLEAQDIPYKVIGMKVTPNKLARSVKTHLRLLSGKGVTDEELHKLCVSLKPIIRNTTGKKIIREAVIKKLMDKIKARDFTEPEGKLAYLILHSEPEKLFIDQDAKAVKKWKRRAENLEKWLNPNIQIGTVHSAKGLEADTVFLDTRITKRVFEEALRDTEGERRVVYVGLTRARETLKLICLKGAYSYEHLGIL